VAPLAAAWGRCWPALDKEVTLIGRREQVAALRRTGGLQVDGALGAFTVSLNAAVGL
jgi:hypothetical protein